MAACGRNPPLVAGADEVALPFDEPWSEAISQLLKVGLPMEKELMRDEIQWCASVDAKGAPQTGRHEVEAALYMFRLLLSLLCFWDLAQVAGPLAG